MDVKDKTVVVTGGGRGIGEALCRRFAREVIVADVNGANARAVAGRIGGATAVCDVGREEDLQHLVGESGEFRPDRSVLFQCRRYGPGGNRGTG